MEDKIREQSKNKQEVEDATLSPEVLEKLKKDGIDPIISLLSSCG